MPPVTEERHEAARIVNSRAGCCAVVTSKRSLENYLAPRAIFAASGIEIAFGDDDDVADLVAQRRHLVQHPDACWAEVAPRGRRRLRNRAKRWLNSLAVDRMTAQQFAESDPAGEIRQWLTVIAEMVASAS